MKAHAVSFLVTVFAVVVGLAVAPKLLSLIPSKAA